MDADKKNVLCAKAHWLSTRINESIEYVARKRIKFQRRASAIKITTIVLSGVITLCLGIESEKYESHLKTTAFSLGALVTVLNAIEPFFNFRSFWIEHEEAKYRFHQLKDRLDYYLVGVQDEVLEEEKLDAFLKEHQDVWDNLSNNWLSYRRSSSEK